MKTKIKIRTLKKPQRKIKIRPIKNPRVVSYMPSRLGFYGGPLELLMEMGYNIYEHPAQEELCIVSPKRLTYRDIRNQCVHYGIDPKWWDKDTDLNSIAKNELDFVNL
jgi:hypothetical protein